ncbi:hypothetical protein BV25DRAFT_1920177 [Artomyces pyxidatus]|uniref:Uncharacterized protein n=1 Tax=Artomyces pyxidatus TaxID=48021 RepID=A0ACB8SNL9_9AGAM|nr:hypothetical protein BV25DRAFT_1920177 [Artomyces pyxidatus]
MDRRIPAFALQARAGVAPVPRLVRTTILFPQIPPTYLYAMFGDRDATDLIILDCELTDGDAWVIPQRRWIAYANTSGVRALTELRRAHLITPLWFIRSGGTPGVRLTEATNAGDATVRFGDRIPLLDRTTMKVRFTLYGHEPVVNQIWIRDSTNPINLATLLLRRVANFTLEYVQSKPVPLKKDGVHLTSGSGKGEIPPERIFVVGVVGVSGGSLTPILEVRN